MRHLLVIAILLLVSCSATKDISDAAREVDKQALGIQTDLDKAVETGGVLDPARPFVDSAHNRAGEIRGQAARVQDAIPAVQDKTPAWLKTLMVFGWALALLALLGVLIYFSPVIRPVLASIGALIPALLPRPAKAWAKLQVEGKTEEATAALRTDPVLDAAYRSAKKESK